ncbi:AAA family ATPase [Promicromonospora sp. NFX87]|uniref:AAA family ATPase n=1 Tax=Promicromonospora sp. NFX87 TaxID=3402691 RepID=UPI003AFB2FAB
MAQQDVPSTPVSSEGVANESAGKGSGALDIGVHGRDRECRAIGVFATDLDSTTLVVSGLSGTGKTSTVLAAMRGSGVQESVVRLVRSCSSRPYAQVLAGGPWLDLSSWVVSAGEQFELDPEGLLEALETDLSTARQDTRRVLFVDDVEVLTPDRVGWLQRLADLAYECGWRVIVAVRHVPQDRLPDDIQVLALGPLDDASLRAVLEEGLRMPVAKDVVARLRWWSSGNPRIALELSGGLSPAQLRGSTEWAGPGRVGRAARRAYRVLLDGLDVPELSALARATEHPLLAVLCREMDGGSEDSAETSIADDEVDLPGAVEAALDALHLEDLAGISAAMVTPRVTAGVVGVALLTGTTLMTGRAGERFLRQMSTAWTDQIWWREPAAVDDATRAAGARVVVALIVLECTGILIDPVGLRRDLALIDLAPDPHWVGLCIRVRSRLLLGEPFEARKLLEDPIGGTSGRSVAEIVARDLAGASVALAEGRPATADEHLSHAAQLRPGIDNWLPVLGLRAVTAALLDGQVPTDRLPSTDAWSVRAAGEFAVSLGVAHLAVGQPVQAAEFLGTGLERCAWSYWGRAQARADLVEAALAADGVLKPRVQRLIEPAVPVEERTDVPAAAAHARMLAVLRGAKAPADLEEWLPALRSPVPPWLRLRSLTIYGQHLLLVHGDREASRRVLREARYLASLAGVPGWRAAVDALLAGYTRSRPGWERLSDDERALVRLAVQGATSAQVADVVYLSVRSVANRFRQIYELVQVRDRRELVERAQADPPDWLADSV